MPEQRLTSSQQIVKSISIGSRIAEDERDALTTYFVETESWRKVRQGDVDIVFAPKGGGKSAIYSMLVSSEDDFFEGNILLVTAENPSGQTVFSEIDSAPPTSEAEFVGLWKLYFLTLLAEKFEDFDFRSRPAKELIRKLREAGILSESKVRKNRVIKSAMDYVKKLFRPVHSIESSVTFTPEGMPIFSPKITFFEPTDAQIKGGVVHIDDLFRMAEDALYDEEQSVWVLLDRLDVAFVDSRELEKNALRALFRVYRDLQSFDRVSLKIFLRSDIWDSVTEGGFREASHITRTLRIEWSESTLLQLALQRLLLSNPLCERYNVNKNEILSNIKEQRAIFYKIFPDQVDQGSKKPSTLDWCLTRTKDGLGNNAPREMIHLLSEVRDSQLVRFETGQPEPEGAAIFDRQSFKDALPQVSETRLKQTLYAEHPSLRSYIEPLEGQKTRHNAASLAVLWQVSEEEAKQTADELANVGFFEPRGHDYWIPFIYRPALELVQGSAEGVSSSDD